MPREFKPRTTSRRNVREGVSRVLLFTDGDFNVGPSSQDEPVQLVELERGNGIGLSVFGYGASIVMTAWRCCPTTVMVWPMPSTRCGRPGGWSCK